METKCFINCGADTAFDALLPPTMISITERAKREDTEMMPKDKM